MDVTQKNIDQYLENIELNADQKDLVLSAITHLVYSRNQNVIRAEASDDATKVKQYLESVNEYDQMINDKIQEILAGKTEITYDF